MKCALNHCVIKCEDGYLVLQSIGKRENMGFEGLENKVLKALAPALDSGGTAAKAVVGMSEANA